jgi:hypothetical protein
MARTSARTAAESTIVLQPFLVGLSSQQLELLVAELQGELKRGSQ